MYSKWEKLSSELAWDQPTLRVTLDTLLLPDGKIVADWPTIHQQDYVNAFVVNPEAEGLILEGYRHGLERTTWGLVGGGLLEDEDAFSAVQRLLVEQTGYQCSQWRHLGSYVIDGQHHIGTGHFFLGYSPTTVSAEQNGKLPHYQPTWVPLNDLKRALWDGRLAVMHYTVNVALALLALGI